MALERWVTKVSSLNVIGSPCRQENTQASRDGSDTLSSAYNICSFGKNAGCLKVKPSQYIFSFTYVYTYLHITRLHLYSPT